MGLFYKYKCKKCGKRYFELPMTCDNCGTELSFVCPLSRWLINPDYKMSKDCEEIHEFVLSFWKSKKTNEFEEKINRLNALLESKQDEIKELRKREIETNKEFRQKENVFQERIWDLETSNSQLNFLINQIQHRLSCLEIENQNLARLNSNLRAEAYKKTFIPQGTIEAVRYAMKKSHPDNGGNSEDFIKFQKVYEELINK